MRVDELSAQKWRKSQATFHELTSQIQELQDRVNLLNDTREWQGVGSPRHVLNRRRRTREGPQPACVQTP